MLPEYMSSETYLSVRNPNNLTDWTKPLIAEHQGRYRWAADHIRDAGRIVDAATGCGWGANFLGKSLPNSEVIGLDIDSNALQQANLLFRRNNVSFHQKDLMDNTPPNMNADTIISFETLEHFPKEMIPQLLENFREMTTDQARLLISSPYGKMFSPYSKREGTPWYIYHHHEYTPEEMQEILAENGWKVNKMYGQRFVNESLYQNVANKLSPIRELAQHFQLRWDHRLNRLPHSLLQRFAGITSSAKVTPIDQSPGTPIYILADCSKIA